MQMVIYAKLYEVRYNRVVSDLSCLESRWVNPLVDNKVFPKLNDKLCLGIGLSHGRMSPLSSDVAQG